MMYLTEHRYILIALFELIVFIFLVHKADKDENMNGGWIVPLVIITAIFLLADVVFIIYNLLK